MKKHLILRTCKHDLTSYNNFQWKMGKNIAPDWDPKPECGKGLHGLLWGEGDANLLSYFPLSKWLVGEINHFIDLDGKVKFPECNIIFIGNQEQATRFLYQNSCDKAISRLIMKGKNLKGGDYSRLTGGNNSNIVAGNHSTVTVGNNSNVTTGDNSTIKTGDGCSIRFNNINANVNNGTYITQNWLIVPKTT